MDVMEIRRRIIASMASGSKLPSFMSKLDGGQLALEQDITGSALQIDHNLGEMPDGICVFRLTGDITSASTESGIIWGFWVYNPTGSTGAWIANSNTYAAKNGSAAVVGAQSNITAGIRNITNAKFDIYGTSGYPLLASENYYWFAWKNK